MQIIGRDAQLSKEQIALAYDTIARVKEFTQELKMALDEQTINFIRDYGDFSVEGIRYYFGIPKKYSINDVERALEVALEVEGGDLSAVAQWFASDPIKAGYARSRLEEKGRPELFDQLFATDETEEVREGKPKQEKKLIKVSEDFIPKRLNSTSQG
jgi:hypothetical protein